ncbi:MAG: capsule assembly Wzi family protein [Spirochaetaceae bacterium]|jgi:hypothetical protein|nr:capsule assembly Wzi family protein [Spirochaetaceae bacterium]
MNYLFVCIFCIISKLLPAQTQEFIPLSSSFYTQIDALYQIYGLGSPSSVRPWTKAEALIILKRLDPAQMTPELVPVYDTLYKEAAAPLRFSLGDSVRMDAHVMLALELYTHSNTSDFVNEEDWLKGYAQRAPFTKLDLNLSLGNWFYLTSDIRYSWNFNSQGQDSYCTPTGIGALIPQTGAEEYPIRTFAAAFAQRFTLNIPPQTLDIDCIFPKRAFLSFGGAHWNFSFGRESLQWGNGQSGNFLIGSHRDFDNFVRFAAFYDKFRYDLLMTIYDKYNYDGSGEKSRYFMLHRLEFRVLPQLVLSLSENIMYQDAYFNIRYLNPAFIYHNWDESDLFNALAHLELDFAFAPHWNFYLQGALDQARAPNESDSEADAWGILGGIEYAHALTFGKRNAVLNLSLEGAYTSPVLYRRDRVDFMILNRRISFNEGNVYALEYIGYQYGGDALVAQFDAHLTVLNKGEAGVRLFAMAHGEMNAFMSHNTEGDNTDRANIIHTTPSGDTVETSFAVSLWGTYTLPPVFKWLSLSVFSQLDIIAKTNKRMYQNNPPFVWYKSGTSTDLQYSLGVQLRW